jgi:thioredoxin
MIENSDTPVLVDFYAVWCGPCVMMSRELATVSTDMGDKIKIVKIDTDKYPNIASRFQIAALPTCVLFKGGKPVERFEGVMPAQQISAKISANL